MEYDQLLVPNSIEEAPEALFLGASSSCKIVDLMQVADMVRQRLELYILRAGANLPLSTIGLTSTSPTPFLGIYGLAEAALYSLRVYHFIISSSATGGSEEATDASSARIEEMVHTIREGWAADPLARYLPLHGLQNLREASLAARAAVGLPSTENELPRADTCPAAGEPRPPVAAIEAAFELMAPAGYEPLTKPLLPLPPTTPSSPMPFALLGANSTSDTVTSTSAASIAGKTGSIGRPMPLLGLGTWQLDGQLAEDTVFLALELGYRHIDCAEAYSNEVHVGKAIKRALAEGIVRREELFVASKISSDHNAGANTPKLVKSQLQQLGLSYFDMYYLHSPMQDVKLQEQTWKALEGLVEQGFIRDLAVSNFDEPTLKFFDGANIKLQPRVIQNKADVYHHGKQLDNQGEDVFREAARRGMVMLAYSPFSSYPFSMLPTEDPFVRAIAQRLPPIPITRVAESGLIPNEKLAEIYDLATGTITISPAMVLLKWGTQLGMAQIPRSTNAQRLAENLIAASALMPMLSDQDIRVLSNLHLLTTSPLCVAV